MSRLWKLKHTNFLLCFFSRSFTLLWLTFRSMTHFEWSFMLRCDVYVEFHASACPNNSAAFVEKSLLPYCLWPVVENHLMICVRLFLNFPVIHVLIALCFDTVGFNVILLFVFYLSHLCSFFLPISWLLLTWVFWEPVFKE